MGEELNEHLNKNAPAEFGIYRAHVFNGDANKGPEVAFLPVGSTITAFLDANTGEKRFDRDAFDLRVCGNPGDFYLEVAAWSGYPSVQPQAANVIRIRLSDKP